VKETFGLEKKGEVARFVKMTFSSRSNCCEFNAYGVCESEVNEVFVSALLKGTFWGQIRVCMRSV
jgi:hypothetical protein